MLENLVELFSECPYLEDGVSAIRIGEFGYAIEPLAQRNEIARYTDGSVRYEEYFELTLRDEFCDKNTENQEIAEVFENVCLWLNDLSDELETLENGNTKVLGIYPSGSFYYKNNRFRQKFTVEILTLK